MDRRSFLRASGAAVASGLLPTIQILGAARTPTIDLADFCDDDRWPIKRYDMTRPFRQAGMTYATDARIAVRTGLILPADSDPEMRLPPASDVFDRMAAAADWKPWPKKRLVCDSDTRCRHSCPVCFGNGRVGPGVCDCQCCGGEGFTFCGATDAELPCTYCKSGKVGGVACDYCNGVGEVEPGRPALQAIGDLIIAPKYDAKIRRLDCVEWAPARNDPRLRDPSAKGIRFRCNGAEGIVMCMAVEPSHV